MRVDQMRLAKNYSHVKITLPIWLTMTEENVIDGEKRSGGRRVREKEKLKKFDQDHN